MSGSALQTFTDNAPVEAAADAALPAESDTSDDTTSDTDNSGDEDAALPDDADDGGSGEMGKEGEGGNGCTNAFVRARQVLVECNSPGRPGQAAGQSGTGPASGGSSAPRGGNVSSWGSQGSTNSGFAPLSLGFCLDNNGSTVKSSIRIVTPGSTEQCKMVTLCRDEAECPCTGGQNVRPVIGAAGGSSGDRVLGNLINCQDSNSPHCTGMKLGDGSLPGGNCPPGQEGCAPSSTSGGLSDGM